jgi:hypothetical protein
MINDNYDLTPEELLQEDREYWLNCELEELEKEAAWVGLSLEDNLRFFT